MDPTRSFSRIKPSDVPLVSLGEGETDRLVAIPAFDALNADFRKSRAFRRIIAKDTRSVIFGEGDVVIRQGDWGNSGFFIVSGSVIVDVGQLPIAVLGRRVVERKGLFSAIAQLWNKPRVAEYRDTTRYREHTGGRRGGAQGRRIYLHDIPAVQKGDVPIELHAGQLFGELGALGRCKRTATVIARGEVELIEMRWQGLRDLMRKDRGFRGTIEATFRQNALKDFLQSSPIFDHLTDNAEAVNEVIAGAELRTYGEYDQVGSYKDLAQAGARVGLKDEPLIAAEGDYPNSAIVIRNGLARVSRKHHNGHVTVSYLGPGQVYGLNEIARGTLPLQNSLRAIGFLTTIEIPAPIVKKHLLDYPSVTASPDEKSPGALPLPGVPMMSTQRIPQDFVEFLVERRFVNGTETMLIDLDRCTRCDDCIHACAAAHDNNPRFVRQGLVNSNIMVANACMHCQDPVCMIECPTGAISRREEDGVVVINDTTCIGCSTCANNCPYDAIRMVEIRNADGSFVRDSETRAPIPKATKCDLCVDQLGGPACQRACPHDALVRMDMQQVDQLVSWQDR